MSGYIDPVKNRYLKGAILTLLNKLVEEEVVVRFVSGSQTQLNQWRPILDLSQLNLYLNPGTFKMENAETIHFSLKKRGGEWVTSLDSSDVYLQINIPVQSPCLGWSQLHWSSPR